MNNLHCIYVPGLNDQNWFNRFLVSLLPKFWKFLGVETLIFSPRWRSDESYESKEKRLLTLIDFLYKQGKQICLIGQSAGGSLVLNVFSKRKDSVIGVINVAGRLRRGFQVFPSLSLAGRSSVAFQTSVEKCEDLTEKGFSIADRKRIMTIRPMWDEVVPSSTVSVSGARNDKVPLFEHSLGGCGILLFYARRLFSFIRNTCRDKDVMRKCLIVRRREQTKVGKKFSDTTIQQKLFRKVEWKRAKTVCTYVSLAEEVDTRKIIAKLLFEKKRVVVPKISDTKRVKLYGIHSFSDLTQGSFGILEPKETAIEVSRGSIDLFIVPGIAFDRKGNRLGWGKGHYDQLLQGVIASKIALAYSFQVVDEVPRATHDVCMNTIITEKEAIDIP